MSTEAPIGGVGMSTRSAAGVVNQNSVYRPVWTVAAWFVHRPCGICLTINDALMETPGAREWVEAWFRLRALTQGHTFGVLSALDLATFAPFVAGHHHAAVA